MDNSSVNLSNTIVEYYNYSQQINSLKKQLADCEAKKDELNDVIGKELADRNIDNFLEQNGKYIACYTSRKNIKYNDDKAVIDYLKNKELYKFIKVKESISLASLNKELKNNPTLAKDLAPYYVESTTYVTSVQLKENYDKVQQYVKEGKTLSEAYEMLNK